MEMPLLHKFRAGADIMKQDGTFKYPSYVQDIMGPLFFDYGFPSIQMGAPLQIQKILRLPGPNC